MKSLLYITLVTSTLTTIQIEGTRKSTHKTPRYALVSLVQNTVAESTDTENTKKQFKPLQKFAQTSSEHQSTSLIKAIITIKKEFTKKSKRPLSPVQQEIFGEAIAAVETGALQKVFEKK